MQQQIGESKPKENHKIKSRPEVAHTQQHARSGGSYAVHLTRAAHDCLFRFKKSGKASRTKLGKGLGIRK